MKLSETSTADLMVMVKATAESPTPDEFALRALYAEVDRRMEAADNQVRGALDIGEVMAGIANEIPFVRDVDGIPTEMTTRQHSLFGMYVALDWASGTAVAEVDDLSDVFVAFAATGRKVMEAHASN